MGLLDEMKESREVLDRQIFEEEVAEGKALRDKADVLFNEMFAEGADHEKSKKEHLNLLNELKEFEDTLLNFPILNFLYATIARVALNSFKFDVAIQYAKAGIEVNQSVNDTEGVNANAAVLRDAACLSFAIKEAVKLTEQYPDMASPEEKEALQNIKHKSKNDAAFSKLLATKKRPKSLEYCLDEKLGVEEFALRSLMRQMGISRTTALKYKAVAQEMMNSK